MRVHKRKIQTDEKQTIFGINIMTTGKASFLICCVRVYLPKTRQECERDDDESRNVNNKNVSYRKNTRFNFENCVQELDGRFFTKDEDASVIVAFFDSPSKAIKIFKDIVVSYNNTDEFLSINDGNICLQCRQNALLLILPQIFL